jgi:hypothetical protein
MLQVGRVPETLTVREHVHLFSSYYGTPQPVDQTLAAAGVADIGSPHGGRGTTRPGDRHRARPFPKGPCATTCPRRSTKVGARNRVDAARIARPKGWL